jgi:hypothetical protein
MGELERVVGLHFSSDGYAFLNGVNVLHAQVLVGEIGPEVAGGNDEFRGKESMRFLVRSSNEKGVRSRRNHVDHGVGNLGADVVVPKLEEIVDEDDGLS